MRSVRKVLPNTEGLLLALGKKYLPEGIRIMRKFRCTATAHTAVITRGTRHPGAAARHRQNPKPVGMECSTGPAFGLGRDS
jgi:hypothetical protein